MLVAQALPPLTKVAPLAVLPEPAVGQEIPALAQTAGQLLPDRRIHRPAAIKRRRQVPLIQMGTPRLERSTNNCGTDLEGPRRLLAAGAFLPLGSRQCDTRDRWAFALLPCRTGEAEAPSVTRLMP